MKRAMGATKKVLVALSGGVDSSVCVYLLKQKGYDVAGVVLKMSPAHDQTVRDAQEAADALGIHLYVKDMSEAFSSCVVDYFVREYQNGRTPNPCVVCNPTVKFKALVDAADEYGYDYVATGHYADLIERDGEVLLARGECKQRDQSYMLYRLTQRELTRLMFPLNHMDKQQVRAIAEEAKLPCAKKPDSQEICFIPDNNYAKYIVERTGAVPEEGDFISPEGEVCGKHKGIIHYTIGQRKHLGIALGRPVFVKRIDPVENRIYLADAGQEYYSRAVVRDVTVTTGKPLEPCHVQVKIRSVAPLAGAAVTPLPDKKAEVVFDAPQRAVAKGQSIVFYTPEEIVIGGGFVEEVEE
ncbi:tRNA 2-thiouridine(34) synthase MnmA [Massiliimalia timonensis]|nr:tRNA 2-thiouridine(34) synthase MnmA [Massiliimalia timonensis]